MNITARGLEEYLSECNPSKQISLAEAIANGGLPLSREFTFNDSAIKYAAGDVYSFYGSASLDIEQCFSEIFLEHRVVAFVPYKVTQLPVTFSVKFKVDTMVVITSEFEWHRVRSY